MRLVYKMGGLLEGWENFFDSLNQIGRPEQVAPHWAEVAQKSGMPIDETIWYDDPPASTYPGCVAYKAALFQDEQLAERYLRRLREAVLTERRNISRESVLFELAEEIGFDIDRFREDFLTGRATEAFYEDLREARGRGITGFPTMVITNPIGQETTIVGYRAYGDYENAMKRLAQETLHKMPLLPICDFVEKYGRVATQEVVVVYELERDAALSELEKLTDEGALIREPKAGSEFWRPAQ